MARIAIIGGGIAGISCARALESAGADWELLEGSDALGGRVRTDVVDGFRLDRGFQVYLTAYRAVGEFVDERALGLRHFTSGAMVFDGRGGFARIVHPLRDPVGAVRGVLSRPASALDLARLAPMALAAMRTPAERPGPAEGSTAALLARMDIGPATVDGFLRSFFGGVFLDRSLETDASQFRFTFSNFARGDASVPALGMGELPRHLAAPLPARRIRLGARVASVVHRARGAVVRTADGTERAADAVVIAADMDSAHALDARIPARRWCATTTMHWACESRRVPAPMREPILFLDGTGDGPVNHAACMSSVAPGYAPEGMALLSLSCVDAGPEEGGLAALVARTSAQMDRWFGRGAMAGWRLLRTDRILRALPRQHPGDLASRPSATVDECTVVAGDHVTDGSIDGAWRSGSAAAAAALRLVSR
jgi:phytoene dehydrogenase-like protein